MTPTHQTINSAGSWTTNGHWLSGTMPAYGSNPITIPAGAIVKISSSNFSVNANLIIDGTLIIDGKLTMASGNTITVNSGGKISCCTTCGASDKIDIGTGGAEWDGATGPSTITGPASVSNGVLPIELIDFTAFSGKNIELTWATASELNFHYFSIERSSDGLNFYEIGKIQGHGTTSARQDYSFIDHYPLLGRAYYRLTAVDFDGFQETFKVVAIHFTGENLGARIFPNPSTGGQFQIELTFTPTEPVTILISDLTGVEVYRATMIDQRYSVEGLLNRGTYLVKVFGQGINDVIRVVVR